IADEIPNQKKGYVPHHLPGTNEHLREFPLKRGAPADAALGGAETMYPEYALKMKGIPVAGSIAPATADNKRTIAVSDTQTTGAIEALPVQVNVYMIAGAGGNIAVQAGDDGVLLVDTGIASLTEKAMTAIHQLSNKPIRFIVNTNARADHTGGNDEMDSSW